MFLALKAGALVREAKGIADLRRCLLLLVRVVRDSRLRGNDGVGMAFLLRPIRANAPCMTANAPDIRRQD